MKELVKISKTEKGEVVSARELHSFFEVKTHFTTWIKRMLDYGFELNTDYQPINIFERHSNKIGGTNKLDYALSLDTAKQISMVQRSEKGKQARLYFIKCEKIARQYSSLNQVEREGIKRVNQVEGTFGVRDYLVNRFGKSKGVSIFIWWSKSSHKGITGRTTQKTKKIGIEMGLKSKDRASAKEIVRTIEPHNAFGLYVADLSVMGGASSELAINIGKQASKTIVDKAPLIETNKQLNPF
jgi:phage anti-repressor protein